MDSIAVSQQAETTISVPLQLPSNDGGSCGQFFFGYYDKSPWNLSQRYVLACHSNIECRMPTPNDALDIGIIDISGDQKFQPITQTTAWSWQQSTMLQWWPGDAEICIVFNDRRDGLFVGVVRNIQTGLERLLTRPVAAISRDGSKALSLNFSRLADERPGYGYEGIADPFAQEDAPDADGIHLIDMQTGKADLIISIAQIAAIKPDKTMDDTKHWFNHLMFSPGGQRFIFLHRWRRKDNGHHYTRMFTANADGTDIYCLNDHDMTSHFDWRDDQTILAWARRFDIGDRYYLFSDRSEKVEVFAENTLTPFGDGHCTYSPDGQWVLTDSYPDQDNNRHLMLYNPVEDRLVALGKFYSHPWPTPARCDLHPRWSRDSKQICFDSSHTTKRTINIIDISKRTE